MSWAEWIDDQCRRIDAAGQWRAPRDFDAAGPEGLLAVDPEPGSAGIPVVSFASNDYLGLSQHPAVKAAGLEAIERWGTGAGAARLVVGARPIHRDLEHDLAEWRGTEAALLFPTGFAANLGVLSTFGGPTVRICSDELNHASIVDGCRLARAEVAIYDHGDVDHLAALLRGAERSIVVTDTVFSMDGDRAPLDDIIELCLRTGSLLVVDEAHAVLGPHPDLAAIDGLDSLQVGTLSKTLGSLGGFVAGRRRALELLINRARPFIFTTASSPADTAAARAALQVVRSDEGEALRTTLRRHVARLAPGHPSPILPFVIGDEAEAVAASRALLDRGLLVPAIRPPTVPAGTSRLRVALSAAHTDAQIDQLATVLADLSLTPGVPAARRHPVA